ncbi:hypothetical protein NHG28_06605 [Aerococcaceae bacterium NML201209]|nr:hypothetical protein [Aerococcaceae bacterium NML201209]
MTAEIGILNKNGAVLAADSAVTMSDGVNSKVFNTAKKIFTLSPKHSIGVMIFGNAEIMGVPWEIIIKEFRVFAQGIEFNDFEDCVSEFMNFLKNFEYLSRKDVYVSYLKSEMYQYVQYISYKVNQELQLISQQGSDVNPDIFHELTIKYLQELIEKLLEADCNQEFVNQNLDVILTPISEIFRDVAEKVDMGLVAQSIFNGILTGALDNSLTGVVLAGYGKNDIFPSLRQFSIFGLLDGEIIGRSVHSIKIDSTNNEASLVPFAQSEMVSTIMNGIDPHLSDVFTEKIYALLQEKNQKTEEIERVFKEIGHIQKEVYIDPVLDIIKMQPIEEMAVTAKTFVEITSFKRKIVNILETVGGPVDVLAITKGDGPIWIDRKFYFDINKNIDFKLRKGL